MENIHKLFETRELRGIKKKVMDVNYFEKRIEELDKKGCTWESESTRKLLIESSEQFFDEKIRKQDWKKDSGKWNKNVQKFAKYV